MSGTKVIKAQEGCSCASRAATATWGGVSGRRTLTYLDVSLGVPSTAGSQQRRPNARCAAVGEASEASLDADVTVAHAHA